MIVREVRPEEYEALGALTVAAYRAIIGDDIDAGYSMELADVATRAGVADVLVAVDDHGQLLGGITYIPEPGPMAWFVGDGDAGMRMLAVDPAAQGRGAGALLVRACIDRAQAAGKTRLLLHTTRSMVVAHRLYERAGFRRDPACDRVLEDGLLLLGYVLDLGDRAPRGPGGGTG